MPKLMAERGDLGGALHTALRKLCDSKPTALAWNVINLLTDYDHGLRQHWSAYLDHVWAALDAKRHTFRCYEDVVIVVKAASLGFDYIGHPPRAALVLAFQFFDIGDWQGYCGFLTEE